MDNSEVDLLHMMKITWGNKKKILIYTFLIVIVAVSYSYVQPKYYETQISAFVLPSEPGSSRSKNVLPQEYYERFSKSPKVLNAVLKNLPKEIKLDGNDTPLNNLDSLLHVRSKILKSSSTITSAVLKVTFFIRHQDPYSAYQIAIIWKDVLEKNIGQFGKEVVLSRYPNTEEEIKSSKAKWEKTKEKLIDFKESYSVSKNNLKKESIRNLVRKLYRESEAITGQMFPTDVLLSRNKKLEELIEELKDEKLLIEEQYLLAKKSLSEYKRLLALQPKVMKPPKNYTNEDISSEFLLDSIYKNLLNQNAGLYSRKKRLSNLIEKIEPEINEKPLVADTPEYKQKEQRLKVLSEKIEQHEEELSQLEKQFLDGKIEEKNLLAEEEVLARLFRKKLQKSEEMKFVKASEPMKLDFFISSLEPANFIGTPLERIIFLAFGCGLIFMISATLIKAKIYSQGREKRNVRTSYAEPVEPSPDADDQNGHKRTAKKKNLVPSQSDSKQLQVSKANYSSDLVEASLVEDH
jgi:hypothetical protein